MLWTNFRFSSILKLIPNLLKLYLLHQTLCHIFLISVTNGDKYIFFKLNICIFTKYTFYLKCKQSISFSKVLQLSIKVWRRTRRRIEQCSDMVWQTMRQ
jgi:hypothetical protein